MPCRLLTAFLLIVLAHPGYSQSIASDDAQGVDQGTWQDEARKQGLSEEQIAALQKHDVLLANDDFLQVYSAYSHPNVSVFITSDSLLNAWHVLLEATIVRLEATRMSRLPDALRMILRDLESPRFSVQGQEELNARAIRLARLVIATALRLMDSSYRLGDAELDDIIAVECSRIEAAEGEFLPEWLGGRDPELLSIHYSRFRPRSFYTRSVELERYFRAVSWLQAIPFRIEKDHELLAMLMLGDAIERKTADLDLDFNTWPTESRKLQDTFRCFNEFVGAPDLPDILVAAEAAHFLSSDVFYRLKEEASERAERRRHEPDGDTAVPAAADDPGNSDKSDDDLGQDSAGVIGQFEVGEPRELKEVTLSLTELQQWRNDLKEQFQQSQFAPQINDQNRLPAAESAVVDALQFRVISASRTPDAILFQRTTDMRRWARPYPNGLEIAVALGSDAARSYLQDPEKERLLQEIDACKALFGTGEVYGAWLHALSALLDEPELDAPDFMRNDVWQRKSCNTVLASWVQMRHTFALHVKINGGYSGGRRPPPGFVEPDPEFFSRMADLAHQTKQAIFLQGDLLQVPPDYRPLLPILESLRGLAQGVHDGVAMDRKFREQREVDHWLYSVAWDLNELLSEQSDDQTPFGEKWNRMIDQQFTQAAIDSIRHWAVGISNSEAAYQKDEAAWGDQRKWILQGQISGLIILTDEHSSRKLPWPDRWIQICDQHLPGLPTSLRKMSEGIASVSAMEAQLNAPGVFHGGLRREVHHVVLELAAARSDSTMSFSDQWDRTIDELLEQLRDESSPKHPNLTAIVTTDDSDLREAWSSLVDTSRQLEVIAHKQFRGVDLNSTESGLINTYGDRLAELKLLGPVAPPAPGEDDVPRVASVYANFPQGGILHGAISRPRFLWVLYPWHGTKILSRGAVLPYREFISGVPLTDEEWRGQLDAGTAPPLPEWLEPLLSPSTPDSARPSATR